MGTLFWDCRNFLYICIGLWIIVSCTIVYRFSKLYPGLWEGSLCVVTKHNWSNRQHIVSQQVGTRHLSICGIGFTMPAIVIKLCKKLQYWELGMGSWCEINWLSLIFTSHWVPVEKFWNSSTNFSLLENIFLENKRIWELHQFWFKLFPGRALCHHKIWQLTPAFS